MEETRELQGCKVARHLKEVFGEEISLPLMAELGQHTPSLKPTVNYQ